MSDNENLRSEMMINKGTNEKKTQKLADPFTGSLKTTLNGMGDCDVGFGSEEDNFFIVGGSSSNRITS